MAWAWTGAERRGACVVLALYLTGTAWDLWRIAHPVPAPRGERAEAGASSAGISPPSGAPAPAPDTSAHAPGAPLDLNRAGESELDALPGIGPVLARRIASHRAEFGPFRRVEDLRAVRGVGPRLYERIAPRVFVKPLPPPVAPLPASRPRVVRNATGPLHRASAAGAGRDSGR